MLRTGVLIVVAFASAMLGALVVSRRTPPPAPAQPTAARDDGAELERRLPLVALAAAAAHTAAPEAEPAHTAVPDAETPRTDPQARLGDLARARAEARGREEQVHAELIEAHRAERRDDAWAGGHETKLRETYAGLAADGAFEVRGVDCRSHTCVVDVQFPSAAAGAEHARDLVDARGVPCGRRITLPDAPDPAAPLAAQILVQCPEGS
jgi:hypothetical protein